MVVFCCLATAPLGYRTDGDLYVGTVGQFSGADPLIYRKPLRTEQFDLKHLNAPQFVSSMHLGGFVYFFFRESAVEYINCGKAIYSRVARVCTNDQGGPHKFKERFTSFLKARLNCSIPGEVPFYFNELQSTSPIVEGSYRGERARLIYSILTTGPNSISGSAVCAFRLEDIDTAFHGAFKGQEDKNSNWLPVINSKVPEPRPGQCVNSSKSLPDATLNFIANHPLMDQAVPAYLGRPVVVHTGFTYRYTYITVDGQVEATSGKPYDVLFIGTDHGHVLKVINIASLAEGSDSQQPASPVIVEDVHVFGKASGEPFASTAHSGPIAITHLVVQRSPYEQKLIVDPYCAWNLDERKCTHNWRRNRHASVQSVERGWDERCGTNTEDLGTGELNEVSRNRLLLGDSASLHLRLRDAPDAAAKDGPKGAAATLLNHFNHSLAVHPCLPCVAPNSSRDGKLSAVSHAPAARPYPNSVAIVGDSRGSPPSDVGGGERPYPDVTNVVRTSGPLFPPSSEYSAETLAIAVTTSIVTALVVGFISGYIFARRCKNDIDMDSVPEEYTRYVDVNRMGGLMGPDLGMGGGYGGAHYEPTYALPPGMNVGGPRPINLVLNKNGKPTNHLSNHPGANLANSPMGINNSENKTTLQKVSNSAMSSRRRATREFEKLEKVAAQLGVCKEDLPIAKSPGPGTSRVSDLRGSRQQSGPVWLDVRSVLRERSDVASEQSPDPSLIDACGTLSPHG
ncbi:semaphorin-1A-like [Tropilaelaps mercedesae]|uniref:Semaphorin-1A-like n=1 Tax=Tropilaelaps mercedesae TaxID=418985 RepID=A0A1V9X7W7_9ACAR|nr:semaphorin-1A-like [Tropilaelaps mercedesae]